MSSGGAGARWRLRGQEVHRYHALAGPWRAYVVDAARGVGSSTRGDVFCKATCRSQGMAKADIVHVSEGPQVKHVTLWWGHPLSAGLAVPNVPTPIPTLFSHPLPLVSKAECLHRAPQLLPTRVIGPGGCGAGCKASALGCRGTSAGPRTQGPWKELSGCEVVCTHQTPERRIRLLTATWESWSLHFHFVS